MAPPTMPPRTRDAAPARPPSRAPAGSTTGRKPPPRPHHPPSSTPSTAQTTLNAPQSTHQPPPARAPNTQSAPSGRPSPISAPTTGFATKRPPPLAPATPVRAPLASAVAMAVGSPAVRSLASPALSAPGTPVPTRINARLQTAWDHMGRAMQYLDPDSSVASSSAGSDDDDELGDAGGGRTAPRTPLVHRLVAAIEETLGVELVSARDPRMDIGVVRARLAHWLQSRQLGEGHDPETCPAHMADRADLAHQVMEMDAESRDLRAQLAEARREHARQLETMRDVLDARDREVADLMADRRQMAERADRAEAASSKNDSQLVATLRADLAQANRDLAAALAATASAEAESRRLQSVADEKDKQNALLVKNRTETRAQLDAILAELQHMQRQKDDEVARFHEARAALQDKIDELESELVNTRGQAHDRTEHARQARAQLAERDAELTRVERDRAELRAQVERLTGEVSAREKDLATARQDAAVARAQLDERGRNDGDAVNRLRSERDQLLAHRRDLDRQLQNVARERDQHLESLRRHEAQVKDLGRQLDAATQAVHDLKHQQTLLSSAHDRIDREKHAVQALLDKAEKAHRAADEALQQTRRDLETSTLQLANAKEHHAALQRRIQDMGEKYQETKRELATARQVGEVHAQQLATVELQYKQSIQDARDLEAKVQTLEARLDQKHAEIQRLNDLNRHDHDQFSGKVSALAGRAQELEKQLVAAQAEAQLVADERNRLVDQNRSLLSRIERHAQQRTAVEEQLAAAQDARDRLDRRCRELQKYKAMYQNVLDAGLAATQNTDHHHHHHHHREFDGRATVRSTMAASTRHLPRRDSSFDDALTAGDAMDLLAEQQQVLLRCRRLVQSAAQFTELNLDPDVLSGAALTTTEDILEALETIFSALCRQAARASAAATPVPPATPRKPLVVDSAAANVLQSLHAQCVATWTHLQPLLADLVRHHHLDENLARDLDEAARDFAPNPADALGDSGLLTTGPVATLAPVPRPSCSDSTRSCRISPHRVTSKYKDVVRQLQTKFIAAPVAPVAAAEPTANEALQFEMDGLKTKLARALTLLDVAEQKRTKDRRERRAKDEALRRPCGVCGHRPVVEAAEAEATGAAGKWKPASRMDENRGARVIPVE
ncbi:hypothetical protein AMAG_12529 [Allomyces macrogynus ATCC 38327]|uniref:Uncharacterized protein n=1 Tax=Allomyces macrogynus (strain ATCC 38327) TaxID=578462 RepID=A0A0L0SZ19_ALLM3|nr:hypothetical protein AMAG_12529 [Allomyces macrogynus ATCC 38327]|eukprot:KNE67808.1 hypothetical protein AMAG_12529 [Allomyces macrogynus ATCC 38327]